ncbi:cytochrome P460 family protein [Jannaschia sp. Os4]|uniref:cytochrome P460 family protein n=1 Tax=Jannaschia sp. Os4 TaxID=2807617 RepID=UPI00193ACBAC|nr:cytochrome P460 family protein [Jannaschia sp. Os4]MBM2577424.1 cytochrome P460 family protein [Jannaschia sp. Os4]
MRPTAALLACAALVAPAAPAAAQEACALPADRYDMTAAQVDALYDCMEGRMIDGYQAQGDAVAMAYRGWTQASTRPAVAGVHGERFLNTFVNDVAAEQYLRFEEGTFEMPVGSVLAKEMIGVRGNGEARRAPLLIMTKVEDAPETDGWRYSGVQPTGQALNVSQSFCHDCHGGYDASDSMGYPLEEVRASAE